MYKMQAIAQNKRANVRIVTGYGDTLEECKKDALLRLKRGERILAWDEMRKPWTLEVVQCGKL
jgi:uncharacterized protein YheU (UPF0270 family)